MMYKRLKITQALIFSALIASCSTVIEPPNGMVNWSLANTTGSKVTMSVYDKVCNRSYFRVPIPRAREKSISTCADLDGKADIRYRRYSFKTTADNPWLETKLTKNQALMIR